MITDKLSNFPRLVEKDAGGKTNHLPPQLGQGDLLDLAGIGLWLFDAFGKTTCVNGAIASLLGYSREEMLALPLAAFTGQEGLAEAAQRMRAARQKTAEKFETKLLHRDGSEIWVNVSSIPSFDAAKIFLGTTWVLLDITESKRLQQEMARDNDLLNAVVANAEQSSREREERYRAVLENIEDGYFECDLAGKLVFCNRAFCLIHDLDKDAILKADFRDHVTSETARRIYQAFHQVYLSGEPLPSFEIEFIKPDGATRYVEESVSLIYGEHGNATGFRGIVRDTTERRKTEDRIRRLEERFRTIANSAPVMIWLSKPDKSCSFFNQRWLDFVGRTLEQEIGDGWIENIHPDDLERMLGVCTSSFHARIPFKMEFRLRRHDGVYRWILDEGVPRYLPNGEFVGFIGSSIDITDRKETERLIEGQVKVLEMIATGASLKETLEAIVRLVEEVSQNTICSILLLDETSKTLSHGAAINLPEDYVRQIDGVSIGPRAGSCGTAAYIQETVIVADIAQDPLWADYRDLALKHGLRACWSVPIFSTTRRVFGTFAVYYREAGAPKPDEVKLIGTLAQVASIAIERTRAEQKRKLAEDALRASEERFAKAFNASPQPMAILELPSRTYTNVNDALIRSSGYTAKEMIGRTTSELNIWVNPAYPRLVSELLDKQGFVRNLETSFRTKSGEIREFLYSAEQIVFNDQPHILVVANDITERNRVEEALRQNEALLRSVIESNPDWIFVKDRAHRYKLVNQTFANSLHLLPLDFAGKDDLELGFPEEQVKGDPERGIRGFWADDREVLDTGRTKIIEAEPVEVDGSTHLFNTIKVPLLDTTGKVWGVLGVSRDITELKRAEAALRASEERFAKAFEASPQPMVIFEASERRIVNANEAMVRTFGWPVEEMTGRTPADLNIWVEMEQQSRVRALLISQGFVRDLEIKFRTKAGEVREFLYSAETISLNNHPHVLVVASDITERKLIEQQLAQSNEQMRALAAHLETVREEERTRIAREIHDNLGQTLTGLKLEFSWLGKNLARATDESLRRKALPKLKEIAGLLEETIQTVRHIATELRPGVLDTLGLSAAIDWQSREFARRSGIQCEIQLCHEPQGFPAECATALFRIFQEILTNIARHSRARWFNVRMAEACGDLILTVRDNGVGITEEQLRNPNSLGLIGMRERALIFGGRVLIEGRKGGTIVNVKMPALR